MKTIKRGRDARETMLEGLNTAVDMAKVTLGGKGKNVMINTGGMIHTTKDGVTVLRNVAMVDDTEDMGVKLVLEAAENQVRECGDGTTSVSILLQAIINKGLEAVDNGEDLLKVTIGIEKAVKIVVQHLEQMSKEIKRNGKEVFQIAKVSAHGDEDVAEIVAEAISKTGKHSNITVQESKGTETYVELLEGIKYPSGYLSHLFITDNKKMAADLEDPYILIYTGKIYNLEMIIGLMDKVNRAQKPLVIISDNLDSESLASFAVNVHQGRIKGVAIEPFGHNAVDRVARLQDLSAATGAKIFSPDEGVENLNEVELEELGVAKRIITTQKSTLIITDDNLENEENFKKRIEELEHHIKEADENRFEEELLKGRLASLTGGVGIIHVGGTVGTEVKERKDRVDDALGASLAAVESGVVPGGGISLLLTQKELASSMLSIKRNWFHRLFGLRSIKGEELGKRIVYEALALPFRQIMMNSGHNPNKISQELNDKPVGTGYNVITDEYVDMIKTGLIDPTKVEVNVIQNASSIAIQFLNTEGSITPQINSKL